MELKKIKINVGAGACSIAEIGYINSNAINDLTPMEFPIINGKSPNTSTVIPEIITNEPTEQEVKKDAI